MECPTGSTVSSQRRGEIIYLSIWTWIFILNCPRREITLWLQGSLSLDWWSTWNICWLFHLWFVQSDFGLVISICLQDYLINKKNCFVGIKTKKKKDHSSVVPANWVTNQCKLFLSILRINIKRLYQKELLFQLISKSALIRHLSFSGRLLFVTPSEIRRLF